jgi:hypothetical protein
MFVCDDDLITDGYIDLVISVFEANPSVAAVFNNSHSHSREYYYSQDIRGGCLCRKGHEGVRIAITYGQTMAGNAYRSSMVNHNSFKLDHSLFPQVWLSLNLAMQHDVYLLYSATEYSINNAYVHIVTKDKEIGGANMLYRVQYGFMSWDVGMPELVNICLVAVREFPTDLGWHFYHEFIYPKFSHWVVAVLRQWYLDGNYEGVWVMMNRLIRNDYLKYSICFWQTLVISFLSDGTFRASDTLSVIILGCCMLMWRLLIVLREYIDVGGSDFYYVGRFPRKDIAEIVHSQCSNITVYTDIGYSSVTAVRDLEYELYL